MEDKIFVVAIGGTGMRCLESFVHLCAIGMFDNKEIDILTLDTDQSNGNKKRVEDLVDHYIRIKTPNGASSADVGGDPEKDTFFSAKLRLTKYWMDYGDGRDNFNILSKISSTSQDSKDLVDLFFDESVQKFNLNHGYRAQTHLGSMLMYHGIVESAMRVKTNHASVAKVDKDFMDYLTRMVDAKSNAKVFVFGSIFGGTGASSIPVLPKAFEDAYNTANSSSTSLQAKFAASLLTEYFTFKPPTKADKQTPGNEVIASANNFTLNSQAALQFYQNDPTVKANYKALYHVGWPVTNIDFSEGKNESATVTGGDKQKNPCHVTELLCAFGAWDFIHNGDAYNEKNAQYLVRSAEMQNGQFNFDWKDMCDQEKKFKNALAGFYSMSLFTLAYHQGMGDGQEGITGWVTRMQKQGFNMYDNKISNDEKKDINDYMKKFLFETDGRGGINKGWLYQIKDSFAGHFLLPESSFPLDLNGIMAVNPGCLLPDDESKWGMSKGGMMGGPKPKNVADTFDDFIDEFKKEEHHADLSGKTGKEDLIAHMYNTITVKQGILKK